MALIVGNSGAVLIQGLNGVKWTGDTLSQPDRAEVFANPGKEVICYSLETDNQHLLIISIFHIQVLICLSPYFLHSNEAHGVKQCRHLPHNQIACIKVPILGLKAHQNQSHLDGILVSMACNGSVLVEEQGGEQ